MSVTAVPLRPIARGSLTRFWLALAAALLLAGGLAWAGTEKLASGPLAQNAGKPGVITLPSGLQYKVESEGQGPSPTEEDVVLVGYTGKLTDGKVFDENPQAAFPVSGLVPGFSEALQHMKRGGRYTVWIPPHLGYGATPPQGSPIPANAVLVFDVHLLDFKSRAEITEMQRQMQAMRGAGMIPQGAPGDAPPQR
jgi:hypothetical protein